MSIQNAAPLDVEAAVHARYGAAARELEAALCCPTSYDPGLLAAIPAEVLERDYGCGNPSQYLKPGERVLDLGSGSGKICFLASQTVGERGSVIGVDMNDEMLALARRNAPEVARRIGFSNVALKKGRIQDLSLDLERLDAYLRAHPIHTLDDLTRLEAETLRLRQQEPLIPDASIDVVISSCVLNLVRPEDKRALFAEIFRVLKRGGRAIIADIVSDEDVPDRLRQDPDLWSGCISGSLREDLLLEAFEDAGFYGITLLERQSTAWRTVEGIEFFSVTLVAYKGKEGPCMEGRHAVLYGGPFREVTDDDGHRYRRGARTAVCAKTWEILTREPYRKHFELVPPREPVPPEEMTPFPCTQDVLLRDPRETKGADYRLTTEASPATCVTSSTGSGRCC